MAALNYAVHINLSDNEIQNVLLQSLGTAPSSLPGKIYYNSTVGNNNAYLYDGSNWIPLGLKNGSKGDITVSTSVFSGDTWTIENDAVTYAKIQNVSGNNVLLGNNSGVNGIIEELTALEVRSILNIEDGANNYVHPNHTGQVISTGDGATSLSVSAISAQTELTSGLISTDELLVNDGGVLKRMDISVLETYMQNNLSFGGTYDFNVSGTLSSTETVNAQEELKIDGINIISTVSKAGGIVNIELALNASGNYISNAQLSFASSNTIKLNNSASPGQLIDFALSSNQILGRLGGNIQGISFIDDDTFSTATSSNIASAESIKTYVDNAVLGGMIYKGSFDPTASAGAGSPNIKSITSSIGDTYTVTVAGTYNFTSGSALLEVGDVLIAEENGVLGNVNQWTIVNRNIDTSSFIGTYTQTIGNGVDTTIVVTHNLGNQHVIAKVFRESDDNEIICNIINTDSNTTTFNFNTAPTLNQYRVNIIG